MRIKTELLQSLISKAIKGAGNNKMIPITSLIGVEVKNQILTLMTTDGSNHLRVSQKAELDVMEGPLESQEFYTIVNADTLAQLISKTTSEYITFTIAENYLDVKGNGNYKLDIALDEDGNTIKFPEITVQGEKTEINCINLKTMLAAAKESIAKTMEVPCLTGYYISDKMISTNREMMCWIKSKITDTPILISSAMADLIQLLDSDTVELYVNDNILVFKTLNAIIYGKQLEGLEMYPVQPLENLMNLAYDNVLKVNKQDLLNVLDRMNIFVSDYDKNGVFLTITAEGLQITSQKSNASEIINYVNGTTKPELEFRCLIDIEMLKFQIQTISTDEVELHYGQEKSIKLVDGNTILIICLLDND